MDFLPVVADSKHLMYYLVHVHPVFGWFMAAGKGEKVTDYFSRPLSFLADYLDILSQVFGQNFLLNKL